MRPLITLSHWKSLVDFPRRWGVPVHSLTKRPAKVISFTDRFSIPSFPSSLQQASFLSLLSHLHAALGTMGFECLSHGRVGTFELLFKSILWIITVKKKKKRCYTHPLSCSNFFPSSRWTGILSYSIFFLNFSFLFTAPKPSSASPTGEGTPL